MSIGDDTPRGVSAASEDSEAVAKRNKNLQYALKEIIASELNHAQGLKLLINQLKKLKEDTGKVDWTEEIQENIPFLKPVLDLFYADDSDTRKSKKESFSKLIEEMNEKALPTLEKMLALSEEMNASFNELKGSDPDHIELGILSAFEKISEDKNKDLYIEYARLHPSLPWPTPEQKQLLKTEEPEPQDGREGRKGLFVTDLLIEPIQRIPRCPLLVQAVVKNISQNDKASFDAANAVLEKLQETLKNIDEQVREEPHAESAGTTSSDSTVEETSHSPSLLFSASVLPGKHESSSTFNKRSSPDEKEPTDEPPSKGRRSS